MATSKMHNSTQKPSYDNFPRHSSLLCLLVTVTLIILTAGCATSQNAQSAGNLPANFANGKGGFFGFGAKAAKPKNAEESFTDEEFDLLEEELDQQQVEVDDPLEGFNRLMFGLNDTLYFWIYKPCAGTCKAVVPEPVRLGIRNFFKNVSTPVRYVNCLLQGKGQHADTELRRFLVNTTEGILGFGDPAKDKYGLEPKWEDLGQTLAVYGAGSGFYIVWPILGPSNVRDSLGRLGDSFLNPVRYVQPWETSAIISGVRILNEGTFHIGEYEDFKAAALEPYIMMRESYMQHRDQSINK
jgi:phospholipid-binding lipoprotein MlaA